MRSGLGDLRIHRHQIRQFGSKPIGDGAQRVSLLNDVRAVACRDVNHLAWGYEIWVGDFWVRSLQIRQFDPKSVGEAAQGISWLDDVLR